MGILHGLYMGSPIQASTVLGGFSRPIQASPVLRGFSRYLVRNSDRMGRGLLLLTALIIILTVYSSHGCSSKGERYLQRTMSKPSETTVVCASPCVPDQGRRMDEAFKEMMVAHC